MPLHQIRHLIAVGRGRHHLDISLGLEQGGDRIAHYLVVIRENNCQSLAIFCSELKFLHLAGECGAFCLDVGCLEQVRCPKWPF